MKQIKNFPKLQCPFIRKEYHVDIDDWKKHGKELQLRSPWVYLAIDEINPGYEWVFEDKYTVAVEKLDGTNVGIETKDNELISLQNRDNVINPLRLDNKGYLYIIEGVFKSIQKGYVENDKIQYGEVIGEKLQRNPLKVTGHLWFPFDKAFKSLQYKSFKEHDPTYDNLSAWFKDYLKSRFVIKYHKIPYEKCDVMAEGVIFYNMKRKEEGKYPYMAKLRRDMFDWYYSDKIKILDERVRDD